MNTPPDSAQPPARPGTKTRAFVFAGGGTGGHIYPALAIIEQLRAIDPGVTVHILCSDRPNDAAILSPGDVGFTPLRAKAMILRPRSLLRFIAGWGPSVRATRRLVRALKQTHDSVVLVAMGGFVAAPAARAGHREGIRVALVNLDAVPGKANELIARRASPIWTAIEVQGHPDWGRVRPIVRGAILDAPDPATARARFGLDPHTSTLLITGGSTGASSINDLVLALLKAHHEAFMTWQVIHQVGTQVSDERVGQIRDAYREAGVAAWVERSISDMGGAYGAADLGIGRCGAGSVAECWASRLPSVLLPYPYHRDQHQLHNAAILVEAGAAVVLTDRIDADDNLRQHAAAIIALLGDPGRRQAMGAAFASLGRPDGGAQIARELVEIA